MPAHGLAWYIERWPKRVKTEIKTHWDFIFDLCCGLFAFHLFSITEEFHAGNQNVNLNVGNTALLSNIHLTLEQGKIYGVLGPNGAGKTTLFKSMLGLTAFSGEILSDGQPVSSRCFGSLIEYPAFYPRLTVEENLKLHAQYLGLKRPNIEAALKQVNLLDARKKLFSQLSLGMRQRLGIARAFLGNVQYLLLDEPTNGLDPMGIKEIRLLLKERLKSPQHCILVSTII